MNFRVVGLVFSYLEILWFSGVSGHEVNLLVFMFQSQSVQRQRHDPARRTGGESVQNQHCLLLRPSLSRRRRLFLFYFLISSRRSLGAIVMRDSERLESEKRFQQFAMFSFGDLAYYKVAGNWLELPV